MSHHDTGSDKGHGEPGHVHDETWNRNMMATDDPATTTTDGTALENEEAGGEALGADAEGLTGGLVGAGLGGTVGGPPGAIIGGAMGAAGGAGLGDQAEEEDEERGSADYVDPRRV
jgi:hypothetical protein